MSGLVLSLIVLNVGVRVAKRVVAAHFLQKIHISVQICSSFIVYEKCVFVRTTYLEC